MIKLSVFFSIKKQIKTDKIITRVINTHGRLVYVATSTRTKGNPPGRAARNTDLQRPQHAQLAGLPQSDFGAPKSKFKRVGTCPALTRLRSSQLGYTVRSHPTSHTICRLRELAQRFSAS